MIVIMRDYKGVNVFDRGNIGDTQCMGVGFVRMMQ